MDTWRSEDVFLFPHTAKIEATLVVAFGAYGTDNGFEVGMDGDHLPEGTEGHMESFHASMLLNRDEAQDLYDELGRWLKKQDGSS